MKKYIYDGPVLVFGKVADHKWCATTYAVSKAKAKSNFTYQYKKATNLQPRASVTLPGDVVEG